MNVKQPDLMWARIAEKGLVKHDLFDHSIIRSPRSFGGCSQSISIHVQEPDRLQDHVSADPQTLGTELVDGIFGRVVIDVVVTVCIVNQVRDRDAFTRKWRMVIDNLVAIRKKIRLIAQTAGS